jgi:virginiamycin B lyase
MTLRIDSRLILDSLMPAAVTALAMMFLAAALAPRVFAQAPPPGSVTQYTAPTPLSGPCNLVEGPDGQMWFAEVLAHKIGRIDASTGQIQEFDIPNTVTIGPDPTLPLLGLLGLGPLNTLLMTLSGTSVPLPFPASFECGINNGPDGNIWFTNGVSNLIGYINPSTHAIVTYPVPTLASNVEDIYAGPDNAMWFAEPTAGKIGRFDLASRTITEFSLPNPLSAPIGVFAASDGGIWFPEFVGNKIGRIDVVSKAITEYPVPTPVATPFVLRVETSDGSLWFSEFTGNKIGKISMATGAITEYPLPVPLSGPVSVTLGSDGNIYSDEGLSNKIAKLIPSTGVISEKPIPTLPGAFPEEIRFGTGNKIWFTELVTDQVGSMTLF